MADRHCRFERDPDLVIAIFGHVGKFCSECTRNRRGFTAMQVDGIDDVVGVERLTIVEGYALTDFECPFLGVCRWLPALEQLRHRLIVGVDFDETVHEHVSLIDWNPILQKTRIKIVGGAAAANAELQHSAFLWRAISRCGGWRGDQAAHARDSEKAKTCGACHERAACEVKIVSVLSHALPC